MAVFSSKVYNTSDGSIAYLRKFFLDSDAWEERTAAQGDISDVLPYAERGVNGNDKRLIKGILNL